MSKRELTRWHGTKYQTIAPVLLLTSPCFRQLIHRVSVMMEIKNGKPPKSGDMVSFFCPHHMDQMACAGGIQERLVCMSKKASQRKQNLGGGRGLEP